MNKSHALAILYDLTLTISGELSPAPLMDKVLQRLLYHTGYSVALFLSRVEGGQGRLESTIGDYKLMQLVGERLPLPGTLADFSVTSGHDPELLSKLPLRKPQQTYLKLPVEREGIILLLAEHDPGSPFDLPKLLDPVLRNLAHQYRLCQQLDSSFRDIVEQYSGAQMIQVIYDDIFASTRDGILITDKHQRIIDVNPAFCRVTGYTKDEILGMTPNALSSGRHDESFYEAMWEGIEEDGYWRGEIWNRRKNGDEFLEILNIGMVRDARGEVTNYFAIFTDISELKEVQHQLARAVHYDPLTDLPNRTLLSERTEEAIESARRAEQWLTVACLDIDHFKRINERYGKAFGDKVVVALANRLEQQLKPGEWLARVAGVEFALLMTDKVSVESTAARISELQNLIRQPFDIGQETVYLTACAGITLYPTDNNNADTLLRHAQIALHQAKEVSQDNLHFFDAEQDRQTRDRRSLIDRIRRALETDQLRLYYQPKVSLNEGRITGYEALLRWIDPERGLVSPGEFLPAVETHPLIIEVGDWVIREALRQLAEWRRAGLQTRVSVNIASLHLHLPDFVERLQSALGDQPTVPGECLEIEILESVAMADTNHVREVINRCREFGVLFALDDFGTGYSSLSYLKNLPADILKVDQSFVRDMLTDKNDHAVVAGVISLARVFERQVVAEGVETEKHIAQLRALGCDLVQGYGIARPMPAEEVRTWHAGFTPHVPEASG